jgi:hypothetical protein
VGAAVRCGVGGGGGGGGGRGVFGQACRGAAKEVQNTLRGMHRPGAERTSHGRMHPCVCARRGTLLPLLSVLPLLGPAIYLLLRPKADLSGPPSASS